MTASPTQTWTLIDVTREVRVPADGTGGSPRLAPAALQDALGWKLAPEGLCQGEACVPVPDRSQLVRDGAVDLDAFARLLGRPLAVDAEERVAVLGAAAADRARQIASLEAPDFTLPDLVGKLHSLSDHRGKKVLLIAYASW